jgi:hypothetical protein
MTPEREINPEMTVEILEKMLAVTASANVDKSKSLIKQFFLMQLFYLKTSATHTIGYAYPNNTCCLTYNNTLHLTYSKTSLKSTLTNSLENTVYK